MKNVYLQKAKCSTKKTRQIKKTVNAFHLAMQLDKKELLNSSEHLSTKITDNRYTSETFNID